MLLLTAKVGHDGSQATSRLAAGALLSPATSPITFPRSLEPLC